MSGGKLSLGDLGLLRNAWLARAKDKPAPETLEEFLAETLRILEEWRSRWANLHLRVDPKAFRTQADRDAWRRENSLKAFGLWHAMREVRVYWQECGFFEGNPYDPESGRVIPSESKPKRKAVRP